MNKKQMIEGRLCITMGKTRGKNRDREDFSRLLKKKSKGNKHTSSSKNDEKDMNIIIDKDFQRLLSDEKFLYLYEKSKNIIHDKHCKYAQAIGLKDIEGVTAYDFQAEQCPHCELRACLRMGAEDYDRYRKYEEFFEKIRASNAFVRRLYIDMGCKTKFSAADTLHILHKDEAWKIRLLNSKGRVELSHNDYKLSYYGEFKRFNTYHVQLLFVKVLLLVFYHIRNSIP